MTMSQEALYKKRYHQYGLIAFFFLFLLLFVEPSPPLNILYFLIGFSWALAMNAPGIIDRANERKYRLSLLRVIVFFQKQFNYVVALEPIDWKKSLVRSGGALCFSILLFSLVQEGIFFLSIAGFMIWELVLERKIKPISFGKEVH